MTTRDLFAQRLAESVAMIQSLQGQLDQLAAIAELIVSKLEAGGTMYTAGNGGSAAQAMHLAEELIGRYRADRVPLRALCLNADPTALTCIANDFGFDQVFARQCEALLTEADVLFVFTTSGNSGNLVNALKVSRSRGATSVGLLGRTGGACRSLCDHFLLVSSGQAGHNDSAAIQECHQVALHLICEAIEKHFTKS